MKNLVATGVIILAIITVLVGRNAYQARLADIAETAREDHEVFLVEQEERKIQAAIDKKEAEQAKINELTRGLELEIASLIQDRYFENKQLHMLLVGSDALEDVKNEGFTPWPEILTDTLNEGYGYELFVTEVISFGELTSLEIVNGKLHTDAVEQQADIVIIEPFIWNDNGKVLMEHSLSALTVMIEDFKKVKEDRILVIQPSQPIYNSVNYPRFIEQLKEYAKENDILYLDHWIDWPAISDEDLLIFTDPVDKRRMPTKEGHEQWGSSLAKFFINE